LTSQLYYMHFGPEFLHHDQSHMGIGAGIWIFWIVGRRLMWIVEDGYGRTSVRRTDWFIRSYLGLEECRTHCRHAYGYGFHWLD